MPVIARGHAGYCVNALLQWCRAYVQKSKFSFVKLILHILFPLFIKWYRYVISWGVDKAPLLHPIVVCHLTCN